MVVEETRVTPLRRFANKVPEVTIWLWVIKVLCTDDSSDPDIKSLS
jgi:uncharacterized membrane-anchored protein